VLSVDGDTAHVRWQGQIVAVDVSPVGPVAPGESLLVHAGVALERLAEDEQVDTEALFAEWDAAVDTALAALEGYATAEATEEGPRR
jgi:hydrogenase maturation factor